MKIRITLLIICLLCTLGSQAQGTATHRLMFRGFSLFLSDMATDGKHIMFIGTVEAKEKDRSLRDPHMDSLCCNTQLSEYDKKGVAIVTDLQCRIQDIQILYPQVLHTITYDKAGEQFIIAGSIVKYTGANYDRTEDLFLLTYKPSAEYQWRYGDVPMRNGFIVNDIAIASDGYLLSTVIDSTTGKTKLHIPAIIKLGKRTDKKKGEYSHYPVMAFTYAPVAPINYVQTSLLQGKQGSLYYTTAFYDDAYSPRDIKLWAYKDGVFTDQEFYPFEHPMCLYNFKTTPDDNYLFCYNRYVSEKHFKLVKADKYFRPRWTVDVNYNDYAHFTNEMLCTTTGQLVIPVCTDQKEWSYNVYDNNGTLVKQLKTGASNKTFISTIKQWGNDSFISLITNDKPGEPTLIQIFNLKK